MVRLIVTFCKYSQRMFHQWLLLLYCYKGGYLHVCHFKNGKLAHWESNPCQAPSCANRKKFNKDKTICLFSAVIRNVPNILMRW